MVHLDGKLKTDDMSLVAYISVHGYTPGMERRNDGSNHVFWILSAEECDEFLHGLVEDYQSGAARVEPVRFTRELRAVRRSLYAFIGHRGVPVHNA